MIIPGGRLTLTSGTPVTTSNVTGATSIFYTPYLHNRIDLWDGQRWITIPFTEYTLALGTLTSGKAYDVFAYLDANFALALEIGPAWTSDTARATDIVFTDGRRTKSGDKSRLYLGAFYTTATTTTEDSAQNRLLDNYYNQVSRLLKFEVSGAWSLTVAAGLRNANADAGNRFKIMHGTADRAVHMFIHCTYNSAAADVTVTNGIAFDSTTVISSPFSYAPTSTGTGQYSDAHVPYDATPAVGFHFYQWLESAINGTNTQNVGGLCGVYGIWTN